MFGIVRPRLLRPAVYALVIVQALLSAPVISAAAEPEGAGTTMPCHGEMPAAGDSEMKCACCPDGVTSTAGCLTQCAGAAATLSGFVIPVGIERAERVASAAAIVNGDPSDPPLKPPPIL